MITGSRKFRLVVLTRPEATEPGDVVRSTASVTYNRPFAGGNWASSLIWGRNHKTAEQHNLELLPGRVGGSIQTKELRHRPV